MSYQLPEPAWKPQPMPTYAQAVVPMPMAQTFHFTDYDLPFGRSLFTADQVLAAYLAGMEEAAKVADRLTTALDNGGNEYRREATASQVAAGIRALAADGLVERKG